MGGGAEKERELRRERRGRSDVKLPGKFIGRAVFGLAILLGAWGCQTGQNADPVSPSLTNRAVARVGGTDSARMAEVQIMVTGGAGTVVVNRKPMGLAPQRVSLPVTNQGFLAEPVVVAVRFVAQDVTQSSMTVEEVLELTDKAPVWIEFSRDGARRGFDQKK